MTREVRHRVTGAVMAVGSDTEEALAVVGGWRPLTDDERRERGDDAQQSTPEPTGPPPRAGAGSGRGPWAAYAAARGIEVPDSASREDIVEQLIAAGVPVE